MFRQLAAMACALVFCLQGSQVRAEDAEMRKTLGAQYAKFNQGLIKKDIKSMFSLLTPDAKFIEVGGQKTTREQMHQMMEQMLSTMSLSKATSTIDKLNVSGDTAIAEVTLRSSGAMKGQDKKTHLVGYVSKSRDTWTKTSEGWKLKQIVAVSENMTMDGKPVNYGAPPPAKK